jgi:D-glycero-D-manno-heptose 1,7-bisphosphate phosphatase
MKSPKIMSTKGVILAGGRGERIRPVTDTLPKPLIPINGKPIIAHQLEQLERIGIKEVFVLTGYLASSIKSYCDKLSTTLKITCVESDEANSPAQRLLDIRRIIGDDFLIVYCDNYILADSDIKAVLNSRSSLSLLIERRDVGNVSINEYGFFRYDASERKLENQFVELGNIIVRSNEFMEILDKTRDLPLAIQNFSLENETTAIEITAGLWSVSNLERYLKLINGRKIVLLDRDGVLLEKMPKRKYVVNFRDYRPIIENWNGLKILGDSGVDFVIATNQPGVATGDVTETFLSALHERLVSDMLNFGINILSVYSCKHHWDDDCDCRKPAPGMLNKAIKDFSIDKSHTIYIGDDDRDLLAAQAANIEGLLIGYDHSGKFQYPNIESAIEAILSAIETVE